MMYLIFTMIAGMNGILGVTWRSCTILIVSILMSIVSTYARFVKKDSERGGMIIISAGLVTYVVSRLVGTVMDSWVYYIPIVLASMLYMNKKLIVWENIICIGCNVIACIINASRIMDNGVGTTMVISVLFSGIIGYCTIKVTSLLVEFNKENVDTIVSTAKKQEATNEKITGVADDIAKHFENAMDMLETLQTSVGNSNFSVKNIVDSTEMTAESIQSQSAICVEIGTKTSGAEKVSKEMMEASCRVENTITDIEKEVGELKQQATNVEDASKVTVEVVEKLTHKVQEVESFVGTILSISNQTNLLALNASIEAARAGESGKGFAVVADEIRTLSEQTKEASNNITNIIQELIGDTQKANESINCSVDSVAYQNKLILLTREKSEQVVGEMKILSDEIKSTGNFMKEIIHYMNIITDNISQLSATSEEVAASSNEGLSYSKITVEQVEKCREIFNSIYSLAKELKETD